MEKATYILLAAVGILVAIAIFSFNFLPNKEAVNQNTLPVPETNTEETTEEIEQSLLRYNTGSSHVMPGTDVALYENKNLGIRFGYPKSWGNVTVQYDGEQFLFLFGDDRRLVFSLLSKLPAGRDAYWGDIGYNLHKENLSTFCSSFAGFRFMEWVRSCTPYETNAGDQGIKLEGIYGEWRENAAEIDVYVVLHETSLYTTLVASDERLIDHADVYEGPTENVESLVNSIDFFQNPVPLNE